jgi:hypothetical protein
LVLVRLFYLKISKLYSDSTLKTLHNSYKTCINDEVAKHFTNGTVPSDELCLNEKKEYYNHLHQAKKMEHDNIMKYYRDLLEEFQKEGI